MYTFFSSYDEREIKAQTSDSLHCNIEKKKICFVKFCERKPKS